MSGTLIVTPDRSHQAVRYAAKKLASLCSDDRFDSLRRNDSVVVGTASELGLQCFPLRAFRIFRDGAKLVFTGDRPRSVLAGVLYFLHHHSRGTLPALPIERCSPYAQRLILEDFPFNCYQPTGFDFDSVVYAENLVALGYTTMECNRFSQQEPLGDYFDSYLFTNPSPSQFVWTAWHEDVWERTTIEANAAELRRNVQLALDFDLDPSVTTFLPRPYPSLFFERHPHLRGPFFRHQHLVNGKHAGYHRIDTDHAEGIGFYRAVYQCLLEDNPEIKHFFFWHADQGTGFWKDGEGPRARTEAARLLEFHAMLDALLCQRGSDARVWINPWAMPEDCIDSINRDLPERVGYAVKDNTGSIHYCGTTRSVLPDLTIITPQIGTLYGYVTALASAEGRQTCLCQYQDFSEDLDPVLGVPHPMLTFRKFMALRNCGHDFSATNWGVLSPDVSACTVNQDVIREMTWNGTNSIECFGDIVRALIPGEDAFRSEIVRAWNQIDTALRIWPQFWGLRLQDGGMRFRWLLKPFLLDNSEVKTSQKEYYLGHQIYRIDSPNPFTDYIDLDDCKVDEVIMIYNEMLELFSAAGGIMDAVRAQPGLEQRLVDWVTAQRASLFWCERFFATYRNLFTFHRLPGDSGLTDAHKECLRDEVENTREIIDALQGSRPPLVIATRGKWGQCFGSDIRSDFERKLEILLASASSCNCVCENNEPVTAN